MRNLFQKTLSYRTVTRVVAMMILLMIFINEIFPTTPIHKSDVLNGIDQQQEDCKRARADFQSIWDHHIYHRVPLVGMFTIGTPAWDYALKAFDALEVALDEYRGLPEFLESAPMELLLEFSWTAQTNRVCGLPMMSSLHRTQSSISNILLAVFIPVVVLLIVGLLGRRLSTYQYEPIYVIQLHFQYFKMVNLLDWVSNVAILISLFVLIVDDFQYQFIYILWSVFISYCLTSLSEFEDWKTTLSTSVPLINDRIDFAVLAISYFSVDTPVLPDYRRVFDTQTDPSSFSPDHHPHPHAAASRGAADEFINSVITRMGLEVYSVSPSKMDDSNQFDGLRLHHWAKDLQQQTRIDQLTSRHAIKLIDVDYYLDMNKLMNIGRPILCYTAQPLTPAGHMQETSYTYKDGHYVMRVSGGAKYEHEIWKYDSDVLISRVGQRVVVCLLAQKRLDDLRILVLINPIRIIDGPIADFVSGPVLQKLKPDVYDNIMMTRYQRIKDGEASCYVSLATIGSHVSVELSESVYVGTLARYQAALLQGNKPVSADAERILQTEMIDRRFEASYAASMIHAQFVARQTATLPLDQFLTASTARQYQTLTPLTHEVGKPSVQDFGGKLTEGGVAPVKSFNNDTATVAERITKQRNRITKFPKFLYRNRREFVRFCVGNARNKLTPYTHEQVAEKQNRPTQVANRQRVMGFLYRAKVKLSSFMKREVYSKIVGPRNITTVDPDHQLRLSQFTLPVAEEFKQQHWYAFGHTPSSIAATVSQVARQSNHLIPTDYSKFDGTLSRFHAELEEEIMLAFFPSDLHSELRQLLANEHHARGSTATGVAYNTAWTRLSGSPITSLGNTIVNAFESYSALRSCFTAQDSWDKLGVYGGDDGLVGHLTTAALEKQARATGLKLKATKIERGQPVPFLGRIYLDPWTTDESVIDVRRQLIKLTMASDMQCPRNALLYRKAQAWLVTDPTTPVLHNIARQILRVMPIEAMTERERRFAQRADEFFKDDISYWARANLPFPRISQHTLALKVVADNLGVEASDLTSYLDSLHRTRTIDEILALPIPGMPKPIQVDVPCTIDGLLVHQDSSLDLGPKVKRTFVVPHMRLDRTIKSPHSAFPRVVAENGPASLVVANRLFTPHGPTWVVAASNGQTIIKRSQLSPENLKILERIQCGLNRDETGHSKPKVRKNPVTTRKPHGRKPKRRDLRKGKGRPKVHA